MIRVFLVDDHEVVRRGTAELIRTQPDLDVVGEAPDVRSALARIPATAPDVVLLDVQLPDGNGVELCRQIRSSQPAIRCLMLTAFDDDEAVTAAVVAGAAGYLLKSIAGADLLDHIRRAAQGESLVPRLVSERVRMRLRAHAEPPAGGDDRIGLTLRERQILELIADGLTNREIGEHLGVAEKTVKNYVTGLLAKLGMERRTQVAVYRAAQKASGTGAPPMRIPDRRTPPRGT